MGASHNLMDIDRELLAHYTDPESMKTLIEEGVTSTLFFDEESAEIFQKALDYYIRAEMKSAITRTLIEHEHKGWVEKRGWPEEPHLLSVLVSMLKERFLRNKVQDALRMLAENVMEDPQDALSSGLEMLARVNLDAQSKKRSEYYSEGYESRMDEYHDRAMARGEGRVHEGFYFGWDEVTEFFNGVLPQELVTIAGLTGTGKSWFLAKVALEAARRGVKVYFASLENPKDVMLRRIDCLISGVSYRNYERGTMTQAEVDRMKTAREVSEGLGEYLLIDTPVKMAERRVYDLYARARFYGAEFFVGDQLSWLAPPPDTDRFGGMALTVREIAELGKEFGMASLWASQFNREAAKSRGQRGQLHQFALSSEIENTSDWALSLRRNRDMDDQGVRILEVLKARREELGAWVLRWRFTDATVLEVMREYHEE